jgi:hypothetical protein
LFHADWELDPHLPSTEINLPIFLPATFLNPLFLAKV